jgi:pyruvate formate lyase activating enzyme
MSAADVMVEIRKDRAFFDESGGGVTFSGGEPLMQPDFLLEILKECRGEGISTAVDTSGYADWSILEAILPYVDLFLYDLKAIDQDIHLRCTGVSNHTILDNLFRLSEQSGKIFIRMPIIPGWNDSDEDIRKARTLIATLPHLEGIELMGYHKIGVEKYRRLGRSYSLETLEPPTAENLQNIAKELCCPSVPISAGE